MTKKQNPAKQDPHSIFWVLPATELRHGSTEVNWQEWARFQYICFFFLFRQCQWFVQLQNSSLPSCCWQHQQRPEDLRCKRHSCSQAVDNSRLAVALQRITARKLKNAWILVERGTLLSHRSSGSRICMQSLSSSPAGTPEMALLTVFPSLPFSDLSFKCQLWGPVEVTYNVHFASDWFSLGIPHSQHIPVLLKTRLWNNF